MIACSEIVGKQEMVGARGLKVMMLHLNVVHFFTFNNANDSMHVG